MYGSGGPKAYPGSSAIWGSGACLISFLIIRSRVLHTPWSCKAWLRRSHQGLPQDSLCFHDSTLSYINKKIRLTSFFMIAISYLIFSKAVLYLPTNTLPSFLLFKHFMAYALFPSSVLNTSFTFPKLPLPSSLTTMYWFIFFFPSRSRDVET